MKWLNLDFSRPAVQLGVFALVALGLLGLLDALSADRIAQNQRMLLRQTLEIMIKHGVKHFYLDVRASNFPARKLYQNNGFCDLGIRKNYYRLPEEDAIVMVKHIE